MAVATQPELQFDLGTYATFIEASETRQRRVLNTSGDTFYYDTGSDVSSGDTSVAVGASATFANGQWIISAGHSKLLVFDAAPDASFDDIAVDALTVGSTLGVTGVTTVTGGVAPISQAAHLPCDVDLPVTATSGTDTAFADGTLFLTSVFVPSNFTVTSIGYLVGSVGWTTKIIARIYNSAGTLVASSTTASSGTTAGTAAQLQEIALTATAALKGPQRYFIGISGNGNTAKLRTAPAYTGGGAFCGSVSLTHAATTAVVAPSAFAADKSPFAYLI